MEEPHSLIDLVCFSERNTFSIFFGSLSRDIVDFERYGEERSFEFRMNAKVDSELESGFAEFAFVFSETKRWFELAFKIQDVEVGPTWFSDLEVERPIASCTILDCFCGIGA